MGFTKKEVAFARPPTLHIEFEEFELIANIRFICPLVVFIKCFFQLTLKSSVLGLPTAGCSPPPNHSPVASQSS